MSDENCEGIDDPTCTWADFKREVEKAGVKDSDLICYIDWSALNISDEGKLQFHIKPLGDSITIT